MMSVGVLIWLASELMFFAALFAAYFSTRAAQTSLDGGAMWAEGTSMLNIPLSTGNTAVLVLSSVTCQMGVFAAERGQVGRTAGMFNVAKWGLREWYILTFVMGSVFIAGQVYEYATLFSHGMAPQTNVYWSLFFLATGFHGLHVTGGLIAFLLVLGRTYLARKFTHEQAITAVVVSYYWHFVDVVWIILFGVLYFLR